MLVLLIFGIFLIASAPAEPDCLLREYGKNNKVCVCNSQHCDYYFNDITPDKVNVITSSQEGSRYRKTLQNFENAANSTNLIRINRNQTYQRIYGFGGALTDSAGINIMSLPPAASDHLMRSYFTGRGSMYNFCRIPMGGSDFSTHAYSYDDGVEDKDLKNFKLAEEDFKYKIPLMKMALNLSMYQTQLKFFTSTWIAPKWMKEGGSYKGGFLEEKYFQTWANYFLKFLEEYKKQGLEFWGLTTGNEPLLARISAIKIPSVNWNADKASRWIRDHLGPTLRSSKFSDIKIMAIDDQRSFFKTYVDNVMENKTTRNYVDGFAVHWYLDSMYSPSLLTKTHQKFPDKFILGTEASNEGTSESEKPDSNTNRFFHSKKSHSNHSRGFLPWQQHVVLGSWERGEKYAKDIIDDLNNWVTGWVDWNLALDLLGGPTYIDNIIDAPILVNATAGEFYKQPMYYAIGHFSKFIPEGSVRIGATTNIELPLVALTRPGPDNKTVLVLLNRGDDAVPISVEDDQNFINLNLEKRSITTVIY